MRGKIVKDSAEDHELRVAVRGGIQDRTELRAGAAGGLAGHGAVNEVKDREEDQQQTRDPEFAFGREIGGNDMAETADDRDRVGSQTEFQQEVRGSVREPLEPYAHFFGKCDFTFFFTHRNRNLLHHLQS